MVSPHSRFHIPKSIGSLVPAVKPKTENKNNPATILANIFKKKTLIEVACFSKMYSETSIHRFHGGVWKRNDGSGKTVDAGAYIKLMKTITFACMCLLNQKTYTHNIIASTVKSTLHYFFLRKSLSSFV
jgi:hypothetical protein